ncbi:MAG: prepilin-type N-terminal cleavage/methylation domain-containing protein [Planctomycetota bacterium]|nr:MAG: prepilin-type N-terminal cleavage/methylation domain-containing protein [Planctomycetota bacterium]
MQNPKQVYEKGFTLVELLVALSVASIVFTAVATLAYALSTANDSTRDTSQKQAQLRYATLRISELVRNCTLICKTGGTDFAMWSADDNSNGQININELVYIDTGTNQDHIRIYKCNNSSNPEVTLSEIDSVGTSWWLGYYDIATYTEPVAECSNVQVSFDEAAPLTKFVSISFDIFENGVIRQWQINSALRSWAGHLLNITNDAIVSDDD